MSEDQFHKMKYAVLSHIQQTFEEMEESMAMQHQEKYALLEDAFENANDVDELRIAFEQWHRDHSEDLQMEQDVDELWDGALAVAEDDEDEDDDDDEGDKDKNDDKEEEKEDDYGYGVEKEYEG